MEIKRRLATVEHILDIQPINNANNIEKAQIRGWWVVVQKNVYKVGDLCVYFEIDSLLPIDNPIFKGLEKYNSIKSTLVDGIVHTGYRIKTVKLRGQISQGMILPLHMCFKDEILNDDDVTDILNVVKYEPIEKHGTLPGAQGLPRSTFPNFIPKTDEERVQNIPIYKIIGETFRITEKLDGTSFTAYKKDGFFGVCSRNQDLKESDCLYWQVARKYNIENILEDNYAIQGEIVGPGIQSNRLQLKDIELRLFNLYDIEKQCYIDLYSMISLKNIPKVPDMGYLHFSEENFKTTDDIVNLTSGQKSILNTKLDAEGTVFVQFSNGNKFSFKSINNNYLLKEKN